MADVPATTDLDDPDGARNDSPPNENGLTYGQLLVMNPEGYLFFATAYWEYTQNGGKDQGLTLQDGMVRRV
jgi:hypothetical protein